MAQVEGDVNARIGTDQPRHFVGGLHKAAGGVFNLRQFLKAQEALPVAGANLAEGDVEDVALFVASDDVGFLIQLATGKRLLQLGDVSGFYHPVGGGNHLHAVAQRHVLMWVG